MKKSRGKTKIYLRSKGNLKYGWGHIIRSLNMSHFLAKSGSGAEVHMVAEGDEVVKRFIKSKKRSDRFVTDHITLEEEEGYLNRLRPDVVLVDMLRIPEELLSLYKTRCDRILIFNDMGYAYGAGDIIVHPQILASYPKARRGQTHLNGPDYFVLSEDILKARQKISDRKVASIPRTLLIIMGGCLNDDIFMRCSQVIERLNGARWKTYFVLGYDNNINKGNRRKLEDKGVFLITGTAAIGEVMAKADIAFASSGYVKYELAALGVPSILVSVVVHQEELARPFVEKAGCAEYAGKIGHIKPDDVARSIMNLARDKKRREEMSFIGRSLVDGKAHERIYSKLREALL